MKMPEDVSKSKKKLASMSMPSSRGGDKALELDLAMPAEDASDSQESDPSSEEDDYSSPHDRSNMDEDMEAEQPTKTSGMGAELSHLSDDQLMAELKKRGLDKQLEESAESPDEEAMENDDDSQGGRSLRA